MLPNTWSWARTGILALAATIAVPLAASGAPVAPSGMPAVADGTPAPILVQGEGRDSSASPAYRKCMPDCPSGQKADGRQIRKTDQQSSKKSMKRKKRDADRSLDRDMDGSGSSIILEIPLR